MPTKNSDTTNDKLKFRHMIICKECGAKMPSAEWPDHECPAVDDKPDLTQPETLARLREKFPAMFDETPPDATINKCLLMVEKNWNTIARTLLLQDAEIERLMIAFHDAINRPKGVVPKSGDRFYDQDRE